jgi:hypothetical protein
MPLAAGSVSLRELAIWVRDASAVYRADWEARLDGYVEQTPQAANAVRRLNQGAVDRIVWVMTVAGLEAAY